MRQVEFDRRDVIKAFATIGGAPAAPAFAASAKANPNDEAEWAFVRDAFPLSIPMLNLNNAAISPHPLLVQGALFNAHVYANREPDVNMWEGLDARRAQTKRLLATLADCDPAEVALNRNATEGLCTAIFGIPLAAGDEVLLSDWDCPAVRNAWVQRSKREGISLKWVDFDLMANGDQVAAAYASAIGPRSKVLQLTHVVNHTGRALPVQRLCEMAREHDIQTVVDAAQSFAHINMSFRAFGCDYLATSLHKWLRAPFGTGMLIVGKSRIEALWPHIAPADAAAQGVEKLDHFSLGAYSSPAEAAIQTAIEFHNDIGPEVIRRRLQALSTYWVAQASDIDGLRIHTPMDGPDLGAITLFSVDGLEPEVIEHRLAADHHIRVDTRRQGSVVGVRVSPQIHILKSDLDRFVDALRQVTKTA